VDVPTPERTILHVDLDAFYAAVEQRDDPGLRGRPVIVGGHARRGVVCAASYEARPFGVRSAMPMAQALALCPDAVVITPRMDHYAGVSAAFFAILGGFTPLCEGLSLDEAFLDVTAVRRLHGDGVTVACRIKHLVRERMGLVASVGVAPNKFLAKIASDLKKPDGLVVVPHDGTRAFLDPLPVARLWGVGRVTEAALQQLGIDTIGDVARTPAGLLQARLGRALAAHLAALASGHDEREVEPGRDAVSVGHEDTFDEDVADRHALVPHILDQADRVGARLRAAGLRARVVTLRVKYADHHRVSRRVTLARPSAEDGILARAAVGLLSRVPDIEARGVRLTGVSASGLEPARDEDLVHASPGQQLWLGLGVDAGGSGRARAIQPRGEVLGRVVDGIRARFGTDAIRRAVHVPDPGEDDAG
jgi:DNA polymerase-4